MRRYARRRSSVDERASRQAVDPFITPEEARQVSIDFIARYPDMAGEE